MNTIPCDCCRKPFLPGAMIRIRDGRYCPDCRDTAHECVISGNLLPLILLVQSSCAETGSAARITHFPFRIGQKVRDRRSVNTDEILTIYDTDEATWKVRVKYPNGMVSTTGWPCADFAAVPNEHDAI